MTNKKYIFFDLDGTLTDSQEGITKAVAYALQHFGIEIKDLKQLTPFIGPPLQDSFIKYFDFTEEQAKEGIKIFREYYDVTGKFENRVYDGIHEALQRLQEAGKVLAVATSKPEKVAKQVLDHFDLTKYFEVICGADLEAKRERKAQVIQYALKELGITDVTEVVMVGDREHDVIGAKKCGIDTIGVLFGFGSREELEESGAVAVAETAAEIVTLLLG